MQINKDLDQLQNSFSARPLSSTYVDSLIGNTPLLAIHCHFKGERRTVEYDIKLYTHAELEDMLEEAGMQVISTFGSKEMTPYSVSSPRMIIVSKKH